jgi:hypothetical protein
MTAWVIRMRMPGAFNVGWRRVPREFATQEEAKAAVPSLTAGALSGWEVKIERAAVKVRSMQKMVRF